MASSSPNEEGDAARAPLLDKNLSRRDRMAKPSTLRTVCPYILGNEFCERLAFYGLATNLVTYIGSELGGSPSFAAIMVAIFEGACYTTPLIGAVFADSMWGRYKTIQTFSIIYLIGIMLLTASSWPPFGFLPAPEQKPTWYHYSVLCSALGIIALGTGGIKPNVSSFGADQFNPRNPQDVKEKESFFNYFYATINFGSLFACTIIVYIQDQISWTLGFAVPGIAMLLAIVVFTMGSPVYVHVLPTESPMVRVVKVVAAAMRNKWEKKRHTHEVADVPSDNDGYAAATARLNEAGGASSALVPHEGRRSRRAGEKRLHDSSMLQVPDNAVMSYRWLEDAITEWQTTQGQHMRVGGLAGYTPKQVEEVKLVLRLLPVFFCCILYWTIYTQMSAMFVTQGNAMQRVFTFDGESYKIPAASMAVFNTVAIIVLIWVYDALLEPGLRSMGYKMTMLRRAGWGMVIAAVTMANAAAIEWWRLKLYHEEFCVPCSSPVGGHCRCRTGTAPLSILWQAPQYMLIGLSEVFTSIAQMEFFYDQAPDVMRSCSMALGLLSSALGSYCAGALTWAVQVWSEALTGQQWLPDDLNMGRLDLFFVLMMVIMIFNTVAFVFVAVKYQYKEVEHKEVKVRHVKTNTLAKMSSRRTQSVMHPPGRFSLNGASGSFNAVPSGLHRHNSAGMDEALLPSFPSLGGVPGLPQPVASQGVAGGMYAGGAPSTSIATAAPISIANARGAGPSMRTIRDRDEEAGSDVSESDASGESSSEAGEDDVQNYARSLTYQPMMPARKTGGFH